MGDDGQDEWDKALELDDKPYEDGGLWFKDRSRYDDDFTLDAGPVGTNSTNIDTCFKEGTLITLADGSKKNIEDIKKGDIVKSEKGTSKVKKLLIHEGEFKLWSINNSSPFVTGNHPFKTPDGWGAIEPWTNKDIKDLKPLTADEGKTILIKETESEPILDFELVDKTHNKVYNLELDNEHDYYANGYLVHNKNA